MYLKANQEVCTYNKKYLMEMKSYLMSHQIYSYLYTNYQVI